MSKVIELAREAGVEPTVPDEAWWDEWVFKEDELTKFYELARADLEAEIAELREANDAFGKRQEWWTERMCDLEAENEQLRKERQAFKDVAEYQKAENAKLREATKLLDLALLQAYPRGCDNPKAFELWNAARAALGEEP